MVRDAKKYGCRPCIYQIRSKLPVLPATGNSHWSNPDAICHQMSITPHQKDMYQFHWKASWEDERCWLGWTCERFRICFESGAKGRCGNASQRKRCFWCAAYGLWKKPDISAVCFGEKQSFQLAKYFSRTVNKIDRLNTTPTCSSCHLYICRLFFGLWTFLSLHSCLWRAFRIVL